MDYRILLYIIPDLEWSQLYLYFKTYFGSSDSVPKFNGSCIIKVGHPDNLMEDKLLKVCIMIFHYLYVVVLVQLVDGETQDPTDYYHIYYGPLRGVYVLVMILVGYHVQ